jgi:putative Mg2+ transporter-C (MgtC) family protein
MPIAILKLFAALLIGAIIGAEREYRNKSAGFRTLILICMGACIFTILSQHFVDNKDRIASTIVTGIGFIGAGVIFKEDKAVTGITTAATIWITASLGMACGLGQWTLAIAGVTITFAVLVSLFKIQFYIDRKNNMREYRIVTTSRNADLAEFEAIMKQCHLRYYNMGQQVSAQHTTCSWRTYGTIENQKFFLQALLKNENVAEVGY